MVEATGGPDLLAPLRPGGEPIVKLLHRAQFFFFSGQPRPRSPRGAPPRAARGRGVLARAMATRQGRPVHAFSGLFIGQPDATAMTTAPLIYQIHTTAAWVIWGVRPFTRLVHAWSYPLWFLWRPYIVYRSRVGIPPNEPGTGGRKWRRIDTPY